MDNKIKFIVRLTRVFDLGNGQHGMEIIEQYNTSDREIYPCLLKAMHNTEDRAKPGDTLEIHYDKGEFLPDVTWPVLGAMRLRGKGEWV